MRRYGVIVSMPANQGSSRHAQMRGDMMLASTRLYISSGKMNTSMSESVTAEDLRSRSRGVGPALPSRYLAIDPLCSTNGDHRAAVTWASVSSMMSRPRSSVSHSMVNGMSVRITLS